MTSPNCEHIGPSQPIPFLKYDIDNLNSSLSEPSGL